RHRDGVLSRHHARAETVAGAEFRGSGDPQALLLMTTAIAREGRYFDCLRALESHPDLLAADGPAARDLRRIVLRCYFETRQVDPADRLIDQCPKLDGPDPDLLFKKASVLGLQARYEEASALLLRLNREHPRRLAVLRRLVLVFRTNAQHRQGTRFLRGYA